jgi:hypothetical protein
MTKAEIAIEKLNQLKSDIDQLNDLLEVAVQEKRQRKMKNYAKGARAVFTGLFDTATQPKPPVYTTEQRKAVVAHILLSALGAKHGQQKRLKVFGNE